MNRDLQWYIDRYTKELKLFESMPDYDETMPGIITTKKLIAWLTELQERRGHESESCDWCQGGASDLVYNLDDMEWGGEIDGETGWMTAFHNKIGTIGSRQVKFCPMCGRAVGRASKHD